MKRVGLIRTLSTEARGLLQLHGQILQSAFPFAVVSRAVPFQPEAVHDAESCVRAAPKVVALAKELAPTVDGIIVSCSADPGLAEARLAVDVPVVGAGAAGAAAALAMGARVGVLGLTPEAPEAVASVLGARLLAVESPQSVNFSRELLTPTGVFESLDAGHRLADAEADVILLACTGFTSMGIGKELHRRLGLPVVDGVLAAGAALAAAESGRAMSPASVGTAA
ncbi:Asp/Glu/hydantoin racemase [Arthrobacter crystallopoietes]|uniref:Asp/Glu/hydantoin racemase n=1 Tax=Crystallibacter crystallopoietes TaxID=37928 RepID=A0A1H0ZSL5_9MICC|nr:aspartate/glutamate racemase family protein [Arthrobacter crystallopoietes]AUI51831.1 hydantoin racemase [Arthrobacter crystallopoietes]SDQ30424.1 Asp/Glu/hydantoin racemase [Arthrobacter crystallopoietes]